MIVISQKIIMIAIILSRRYYCLALAKTMYDYFAHWDVFGLLISLRPYVVYGGEWVDNVIKLLLVNQPV